MVEAVVEYDYDAVHPDELSMKVGDIISNINKLEEGWWEGDLNGKRGMFPDNFVKEIEENTRRSSKSKAPGPPVNGDTASIHSSHSQGSQDSQDVIKREGASSKRQVRARVAFSYHPENDDELSLAVDDIVEVTGQPEDGWWEGIVKGSKGVFPSNFVTVLEEDENNMDLNNGKEDKADSPVDSEPKEQTQPPVKPQRPISVHRGSLEPKGEEPAKEEETPALLRPPGPFGGKPPPGSVGFGNIFAGGSVHLRKTNKDPVKGPKKSEPPKRPELSEAAQKRQSLRKPPQPPEDGNKKEKKAEVKPEKNKKEEEKEEKPTEEIEIVGKNDSKPVKIPDAPAVVEKAKVLFDYDAENPDELTLKTGEVVVILHKEAGDSGWWKGELNGKEGVFPENFVECLPLEKIKKKVPAPVPARPTAGHKASEEHKPQTANKPRKGSKDPISKPQVTESETPKEPAITEEKQPNKPYVPPGGKMILPIVPPKKLLKKPPPPKPQLPAQPDKETREVPKRPLSSVDKDHNKEKVPEKKDPPVETQKADKQETTFDDIKPSTEKLHHVNLSRPRHAHKRPPSVFGAVPGLSATDGPLENDTAGPPPRPKTTPSPGSTAPPAPIPSAKQEPSPATSPGNSRPASIDTTEQQNAAVAAATAEMRAAMDEMKKEVKTMQEQMTNMRTEFKKSVKKLMVEVDEEKKLRLSMQVELERIKNLVLDS